MKEEVEKRVVRQREEYRLMSARLFVTIPIL
jgi:hypothetical protein